jgi:hypothetical protein
MHVNIEARPPKYLISKETQNYNSEVVNHKISIPSQRKPLQKMKSEMVVNHSNPPSRSCERKRPPLNPRSVDIYHNKAKAQNL